MSKATQQRKQNARAAAEARRITPGKLLRLFLKSMLFAVVVGLIMVGLQLLGVPIGAGQNSWLTIAVLVAVYLAAYPFLMREFRVKRPKQ